MHFDPHEDQDHFDVLAGQYGPKEKASVLSQAHTRPELLTRIRNYQVPFHNYIDPGSSLQMLNLTLASETKTLCEDYCFYAGYSLTA